MFRIFNVFIIIIVIIVTYGYITVIIVINVFERYELTGSFYNFIRFNKRLKFINKFFKPNGRFEKSVLKLKNKPIRLNYGNN